ncbi:MAG: hypothetical protein WA188_07460 [Terriglobales bacterium]
MRTTYHVRFVAFLVFALLLVGTKLRGQTQGQGGGELTAPKAQARPSSLSEVRVGMPEDFVLAGLSEKYNLSKEKTSEDVARLTHFVHVSAKNADDDFGGMIIFTDGKVQSVKQRVTPYYSGEAISVAKDLWGELVFHTTPAVPRDEASKIAYQYLWTEREGTAHITLRQWTTPDDRTIMIIFDDGAQLNIEVSRSDKPNSKTTVWLEKVRY